MPKRATSIGRAAFTTGRPRLTGLAAIASRAAIAEPLKVALGFGMCSAWWRHGFGYTLGGTLLASGTAPPVVTITGTTGPAIGLHLEIDSVAGGTGLGQATFKVSIDNGGSYILTGQLTGAGVPIGVGITASFAAGPYNIDNKWDATVSGWADQIVTNHLLQATAAKQSLLGVDTANAANANPAVRLDGVDDFFKTAPFTLNQPVTVLIVYKMITLQASAVHDALWDGDTFASMFAVEDTAPQTSLSGVFYGTAVANGFYDQLTVLYNGASSYIRAHGIQVATGNPGAGGGGGFTLGALADGTRGTKIAVTECALYSGPLPLSSLRRFEMADRATFAL